MKRARLVLAVAALVAVGIPSGVFATHGPNDGPTHDFAVGGGISLSGTRFGFAAQETPDGRIHGHATFNNPVGTNRQGEVTCLEVDENRAVFEVRDSDTGDVFGFFVQDNGNPVAGMAVDELRGDTADGCAFPTRAGLILLEGNITVHDGAGQ